MKRLALLLAQGFGVGRIPIAPGTFGSLVGLGWFWLLLQFKNIWGVLGGIVFGLAISVWLCGEGEKILNRKDPGSIVLDEIAAMPVCFLIWIVHIGSLPSSSFFLSKQNWLPMLGVFAAFRFFDVLKPWPARQSQSLPGGWGITADDVLAAVYVNVVALAVISGKIWLAR